MTEHNMQDEKRMAGLAILALEEKRQKISVRSILAGFLSLPIILSLQTELTPARFRPWLTKWKSSFIKRAIL